MINFLMPAVATVTLAILAHGEVITNRMVTLDDYERGFKFAYSKSVVKHTTSRVGCATACASDDLCNSMNVDKNGSKFICEMSSEGTGFMDVDKLETDADFRYYEKKTPCLNGGIWNATTSQCDNCHYLTWGQFCDNYSIDCDDAKSRFPSVTFSYLPTLIQPYLSPVPLMVCCDMTYGFLRWAKRGTGGSENFTRGWQDYKNGFGDLHTCQGEYFLGLEKMYMITHQADYKFVVWLGFVAGGLNNAVKYHHSRVGNESSSYRLQFTDGWLPKDFGDGFAEINGESFFTYNRDCLKAWAKICNSGWWYKENGSGCPDINLHSPQDGLKWPYDGRFEDLSHYDFQLSRH